MASETAVERRRKDEQVRATIHQKLVDTGEKERLKALLRAKLEECGWRDELKAYCKEVIKNKGLEKITVEDLVQEITPRGRATVPSAIKAELLQRIRKFLQANWGVSTLQLHFISIILPLLFFSFFPPLFERFQKKKKTMQKRKDEPNGQSRAEQEN